MDNSEVQERCCKPIGSDYAPRTLRKKFPCELTVRAATQAAGVQAVEGRES